MITITVSGDRGEGKTVTALRVVHMLRGLGFQAEYHGNTVLGTERVREMLSDHPEMMFPEAVDHRSFEVVDRT